MISAAFSDYYSSVNLDQDPNTSHPNTEIITEFLQKVKLPQLSQEHLVALNSPFTPLEIQKTIQSLPNNESPGPDGFTGGVL